MELSVYLVLACVVCLSYADFFDKLDELDLDSQLLEIDKMMNTISSDEDAAMKKLKEKDEKDDEMDLEDALSALSSLLGKGDCNYKCKNGKLKETKVTY